MAVRVWFGGLLVATGGLWLLDALGVLDAPAVVGDWWPLAVVALGVTAAVGQRRLAPGPLVVTVVGVLLLLGRLSDVGLAPYLWPLLMVAVGGWLLVTRVRGGAPDGSPSATESTFAFFGGSETRNRSPHFRHADVTAVMGGATLDLRDAHLEPGARVDALALFGGVDVLVPRGTRVTLHGLPIFGAYGDKTRTDAVLPDDAPTLDVSATAVFGGVEVRHAREVPASREAPPGPVDAVP